MCSDLKCKTTIKQVRKESNVHATENTKNQGWYICIYYELGIMTSLKTMYQSVCNGIMSSSPGGKEGMFKQLCGCWSVLWVNFQTPDGKIFESRIYEVR